MALTAWNSKVQNIVRCFTGNIGRRLLVRSQRSYRADGQISSLSIFAGLAARKADYQMRILCVSADRNGRSIRRLESFYLEGKIRRCAGLSLFTLRDGKLQLCFICSADIFNQSGEPAATVSVDSTSTVAALPSGPTTLPRISFAMRVHPLKFPPQDNHLR